MSRPLFIDVRSADEYTASHVAGAIHLPPESLMSGAAILSDVPYDTPLVLYCRSGARSNVAMQLLSARGYTNLTNGINQQQVESRYHEYL